MKFSASATEPLFASTRNAQQSNGFTLVEILVVLAILGIMGAMVTTAISGVTTTAREARTKSVIAVCDSVVQELYESTKYRPLAVEVPTLSTSFNAPSGNNVTVSQEVLATEAARVRLIMVRDLQKMELPDHHEDYVGATTANVQSRIWAAANPVFFNTSTGQVVGSRDALASRNTLAVNWSLTPKASTYLQRYNSAATTASAAALLTNQGAECLYAIMSNSFVAGSPAIASIPTTNIGDTDEDGLPEILDGWGQPLGFIRWPVGFFDPESDLTTELPDDSDPFRADFAYVNNSNTANATDVNDDIDPTKKPWSIRPLIFSAGNDGQFGIAQVPHVSGTPVTNFSYSHDDWNLQPSTAIADDFMGDESEGRANSVNSYDYPDPYLRRFLTLNPGAILPGQVLPGTNNQEAAIDNITNYSLQGSQ